MRLMISQGFSLPLQSGPRVSCMTVRAAGAGGKYTFGPDEGRKLRLGAVPPHECSTS